MRDVDLVWRSAVCSCPRVAIYWRWGMTKLQSCRRARCCCDIRCNIGDVAGTPRFARRRGTIRVRNRHKKHHHQESGRAALTNDGRHFNLTSRTWQNSLTFHSLYVLKLPDEIYCSLRASAQIEMGRRF